MHFERNLFTAHAKGVKSLNDFKFDAFSGRFPCDVAAASIAVKGFKQHERRKKERSGHYAIKTA